MKIKNYTRYIIGAAVMYSILPLFQSSLSLYNFCILFLLSFVIIKDLNNIGNGGNI